jgi:hypothetical protein
MFRRNIDFLAVLVIAVAMAGFSKARTIRVAEPADMIRWDNVATVDSCPLQHAFSEIAYFLNQ